MFLNSTQKCQKLGFGFTLNWKSPPPPPLSPPLPTFLPAPTFNPIGGMCVLPCWNVCCFTQIQSLWYLCLYMEPASVPLSVLRAGGPSCGGANRHFFDVQVPRRIPTWSTPPPPVTPSWLSTSPAVGCSRLWTTSTRLTGNHPLLPFSSASNGVMLRH